MQKTILFGKKLSLLQNCDPANAEKIKCHNCIRLHSQLLQLQQSIRQSSTKQKQQSMFVEGECSMVNQITELRNKFITLKKRLEVVEKENDQLFEQNSRKNKEIGKLKRQLQEIQKEKEGNQSLLLDNEEQNQFSLTNQKELNELRATHQKAIKQLNVELFVWKDKTQNMQILMRDQSQQIVQLKQILKKRNKLQDQRHKLLQTLCF